MTREQKRRVRAELRACGQGKSDWAGVIALAMDYYEAADPVCKRLLQMRYLDGMPEERVVAKLHIGRTTYYHKELETLSTAASGSAADAGSRNPCSPAARPCKTTAGKMSAVVLLFRWL